MFLNSELCLSVMFDSLSYSFTSISFLTNSLFWHLYQYLSLYLYILFFAEDLIRIVNDVDYIDKFSSVPVRHLTFYIRHLLEPEDIHVHLYSRNIKNIIGKHLPVEYVIYGSVGEDLVFSLYTCGRSMIYPHILYYIPEIADIVYHTEPAPKPHSLLVCSL